MGSVSCENNFFINLKEFYLIKIGFFFFIKRIFLLS